MSSSPRINMKFYNHDTQDNTKCLQVHHPLPPLAGGGDGAGAGGPAGVG